MNMKNNSIENDLDCGDQEVSEDKNNIMWIRDKSDIFGWFCLCLNSLPEATVKSCELIL